MNQFDRVGGKKRVLAELRNLGQVPIAERDTMPVFATEDWKKSVKRKTLKVGSNGEILDEEIGVTPGLTEVGCWQTQKMCS